MIFSSCETDINEVNQITSKEIFAKETAKNVDIIYTENALLEAKLKSPQLDRYETDNPYFEMPIGMKITFYNDEKEKESELTANYGISYDNEEKMEARDDVVVINKKGEKLNTEHLIWDERKEMIYSDEFVKITTKDEILYGEGFEANQNFSKYKIYKIKGTINLADSDSTQNN